MKRNSIIWTLGMAFIASAMLGCGQKADTTAEQAAAEAKDKVAAVAKDAEALVKEKEAQETGIDAYMYAYPLVTMELTRRVSTNVVAPEGSKAPMTQFAKLRGYPAVDDHTVTAPNADTLYTVVWLDVSKEPWIISAPDMKGRFFVLPMLDGWTTVFADPGKRTTGTAAQKFAITGPGWTGTLPAGVTEYKSATAMVWLLGRIYCTGTPEDYKAVHALQDQMTAAPLSSYGKPYTAAPGIVDPSIDMKTSIRDQVNAMDAASYFKLFAQLLKANPPVAEDAPMVAKLAKIGIVPGQDFDASKLDPAVAKGLAAVPKPAQEKIMVWLKEGVVAGECKLTGWLGLHDQDRPVRHELSAAGADHGHRPRGQPPAGCGLPHVRRAGHRQEVQRREQVRPAFQQGRVAAGRRLLVAHHVRRQLLLRAKSDQPVHVEPAQQVEGQRRWIGRSLRPERVARQGQGAELAAGAEGPIHSDDAAVLAEGEVAIDPRRQLEDPAGQGS